MKLGFNWQRGPFELIDAVGLDRLCQLADELGLALPSQLTARSRPYYAVHDSQLDIDTHDKGYQPVALPEGVMRFSLSAGQLKRSAAMTLPAFTGWRVICGWSNFTQRQMR